MPNKSVALVARTNQGIGLQIAKDLSLHSIRSAPRSYSAANRELGRRAGLKTAASGAYGDDSLTERLIDAVSDCVPAIGSEEFTDLFIEIVRLTGAGQVAAFAYRPEEVSCLLNRNFLSEAKGTALAATYLDGWFRDDPLFEQVMAMAENDCAVEHLEDLLPRISSRYLRMFFDAPGFRTKVAVLVVQDSLRMVLNLYFGGDITGHSSQLPDRVGSTTYRLIGKTLATHFLRLNPPECPLPLTVLSERERQVCIGMLAGKKAEIIAEDIGIGPSSVVTYRQRAYQKLGISSRGQLFSICQ